MSPNIYYCKKFNTRNPFEIADYLGILYQIGDIGCSGCYMFLKNHRYIFLNQNLSEPEARMVMAHELGTPSCIEKKTVILSATRRFYLIPK